MEPASDNIDNNNNNNDEIKKNRKINKNNKTNQQKKIEKKLTKQDHHSNNNKKINKLDNEQMEIGESEQSTTLTIPGRGIKLPNKISESVTFLDFDNLANNIIIPPGKLPNTIKKIKFNRMYDSELLPGSIPNGVTDLILGRGKIQLSAIPNSVTNLTISDQFTHEIIPGSIPNSVTSITFTNTSTTTTNNNKDKKKFNNNNEMLSPQQPQQPLILKVDAIPSSVTYLDFGNYNCLLEPGVLPKSIKTLQFGREYDREFSKGSIPDSVTDLTLSHIKFNNNSDGIPSSVINLSFQDNFNKPIELGMLQSASSLETLKFGRNFNSTIAPLSLPSSLRSIVFGYHHNQVIKEYVLPNALTSLEFGFSQREKIDENLLPKSLTNFKTSENYGIGFDCDIRNINNTSVLPTSYVPCNNSYRDVLYDKGYNLD